jgi:hypothetical protein
MHMSVHHCVMSAHHCVMTVQGVSFTSTAACVKRSEFLEWSYFILFECIDMTVVLGQAPRAQLLK